MKLDTIGIDIGAGFPVEAYHRIHAVVVAKHTGHANYDHYAGASNAVAYRFKAATEYAEEFAESLKRYGSSPAPQDRYQQEKLLFGFFSSGFSALESVFFELFVLGAYVAPEAFPLDTPKDRQQVTPKRTVDRFREVFPNDPIIEAFDGVFEDAGFQGFREVRNILTHRAAPGRRMYVSLGLDDAPSTEWKLNSMPLDASIATKGLGDLASLLARLLEAGATFSDTRVK